MRNYSQLEDQCHLQHWFKSLVVRSDLPKLFYLVIDRASELVPGHSGTLAIWDKFYEIKEKTLPVFDNHRVARRFQPRKARPVIKIPDNELLQKTRSHLQAKGNYAAVG